MYKDLGTILLIGSAGTGKTVFINKYISEIINEDADIFLIDPKYVELVKYKNYKNVTYMRTTQEVEQKLISIIGAQRRKKKTYIIVDEYSDIKFCKEVHDGIKKIMYRRQELNIELVLSSQIKTAFCQTMRKNADAIITLNSYPKNK